MSDTVDKILALLDAELDAATAELDRLDAEITATNLRLERAAAARRELSAGADPPVRQPAKKPSRTPKAAKKPARKKLTRRDSATPSVCACGRTFKNNSGLGAHRRTCPDAKKTSPAAASPTIKLVDEPDTRPVRPRFTYPACEVCGAEFALKADLAAHRRREDHYTAEQRAQEQEPVA